MYRTANGGSGTRRIPLGKTGMEFYYVYVLVLNNGQLYVGFCLDLERRMSEHGRGKVTSTRERKPLKLIHYEAYLEKEDAERREKYLKTTKGKRTLKLQLKKFREKRVG